MNLKIDIKDYYINHKMIIDLLNQWDKVNSGYFYSKGGVRYKRINKESALFKDVSNTPYNPIDIMESKWLPDKKMSLREYNKSQNKDKEKIPKQRPISSTPKPILKKPKKITEDEKLRQNTLDKFIVMEKIRLKKILRNHKKFIEVTEQDRDSIMRDIEKLSGSYDVVKLRLKLKKFDLIDF